MTPTTRLQTPGRLSGGMVTEPKRLAVVAGARIRGAGLGSAPCPVDDSTGATHIQIVKKEADHRTRCAFSIVMGLDAAATISLIHLATSS